MQGHKPSKSQTQIQTSALGEIPSYLTDPQREEIDSQTSSLLRDLNGNITNLQQATNLRHDTAQRRLEKKYGKQNGFLLRWAAGGQDPDNDAGKSGQQVQEEGKERTIHMFREGVLWYLNWELKLTVGMQQEMVEIRLEREREKRASVLYDERNRNVKLQRPADFEGVNGELNTADMRGKDSFDPALDAAGGRGEQPELSPEQLQLFEEENSSLMNHYNETLAKVTQAEKSLVEISSLQQTLVGHLTVQGEMIGQLVSDAERTDENVQRGNKELKRASERASTAKIMYHSTLWLCAGLVVWDLIF